MGRRAVSSSTVVEKTLLDCIFLGLILNDMFVHFTKGCGSVGTTTVTLDSLGVSVGTAGFSGVDKTLSVEGSTDSNIIVGDEIDC